MKNCSNYSGSKDRLKEKGIKGFTAIVRIGWNRLSWLLIMIKNWKILWASIWNRRNNEDYSKIAIWRIHFLIHCFGSCGCSQSDLRRRPNWPVDMATAYSRWSLLPTTTFSGLSIRETVFLNFRPTLVSHWHCIFQVHLWSHDQLAVYIPNRIFESKNVFHVLELFWV